MTDLRQQVVDNRGILKKIELCLPGFRGYRIKEDIRAADNILRAYLADELECGVQNKLNRVREIFSKSFEMDLLNDIGELINKNKGLTAKIRHAEHGYSGISPQYRIDENSLNRIYDFDYRLLESIRLIQAKSDVLLDQAKGKALAKIPESYADIREEIEKLDELFKMRQVQLIGLMQGNTGA
jgi:hypothetical protein